MPLGPELENCPWNELYTKKWTRGTFRTDLLDGMPLFVPYEGADADEYDEEVLPNEEI